MDDDVDGSHLLSRKAAAGNTSASAEQARKGDYGERQWHRRKERHRSGESRGHRITRGEGCKVVTTMQRRFPRMTSTLGMSAPGAHKEEGGGDETQKEEWWTGFPFRSFCSVCPFLSHTTHTHTHTHTYPRCTRLSFSCVPPQVLSIALSSSLQSQGFHCVFAPFLTRPALSFANLFLFLFRALSAPLSHCALAFGHLSPGLPLPFCCCY